MFGKKKRAQWFMKNADKVAVGGERCCPKHYFPHAIPLVHVAVEDEPCHYHLPLKKPRSFISKFLALYRQKGHHEPFCKWISEGWTECPHRRAMLAAYEEARERLEEREQTPVLVPSEDIA